LVLPELTLNKLFWTKLEPGVPGRATSTVCFSWAKTYKA